MTERPPRRTLGSYELIEPLARGSITQAHRAKSFGVEGFEKTLLVKEVLPEFARDEAFVAAFLEHVQKAMRLSHANLAQVFDLGHAEGSEGPTYFLATEYVAGLDVATLLERYRASGALPKVSIGAYLGLEVGKALDHAHRRRDAELRPLSVVHGAVAPHNVLVSFDGDVKVTDFGVTRALLSLQPRDDFVRTYAAASPEHVASAELSTASDVFSLGVFLYEVLSGVSPFRGKSAGETFRLLADAEPPELRSLRAEIPEPLSELVHRALSRDADERVASVSSLYEELLACTFACGLRSSQAELAEALERYREPVSSPQTDAIPSLLSRPLTVPPPVAVPSERAVSQVSVAPFTGFGDLRHVSILVLRLSQEGPLPGSLEARARASVERYGGTLLRKGDHEMIAVFGAERSDGRDAELAVRCGLVLVRGLDVAGVHPVVGIDSGRLRFDRELRPVEDERLGRLESQARVLAGEATRAVVVSGRAARLLRGRFPFEPLPAGFRVTEFAQDGFLESFVGRKAELSQLAESLVRAARGDLRLLGIVGEPGIGKTRLAVETQRRLARGSIDLQTYFATCPPRGRELPDSGIVAMLRRVAGLRDGDPPERIQALEPRLRALGLHAEEVAAILAGVGATQGGSLSGAPALRSGFLRMMQSLAEDRFTVFFWDDAHELDAATVEVLSRAVTRLADSRIAIVLSARSDPGAPYHALPLHSEIRLGEMSPDDVARLVAERIGASQVPEELLAFLRERAGGQPMFVEELLRQLIDGGSLVVEDGSVTRLSLDEGVRVPRSLRAVTAERLRRLGPDERHLFVAAAVLEPHAEAEVLAKMLELSVPTVESIAESLIAQGLLAREGPQAFGFPSPLAREVVLAELDAEDAAVLHRRAAEAYLAVLPKEADGEADRIGYHLAAANDRDGAAACYARSGLYYVSERKLERAAMDLAYALDLATLRGSAAQVGNWLRALSTAVRYVRTGPNLPPLIERLTSRLENEALDSELRIRMAIDLACILGALGQELAAEALLERVAARARQTDDVATLLLIEFAELASGRGDFRLARRALDPLGKRVISDREERHRVLLATARVAAASGQMNEAEAALGEAARLVGPDNPLLSLDRATVRTAVLGCAGRFRESADSAVLAAAHAEELGLLHEVASSLADQAVALARGGDSARARAAASSAFEVAQAIDADRVLLRCRLVLSALEGGAEGSLDAERGDIARAESQGWISDALVGRLFLARLAARVTSADMARTELMLATRIATSTGNLALADQLGMELSQLG